MKKIACSSLLLASLVFSAQAFAKNKTDANEDGFVSRDEQYAADFGRYEKRFNKADTNQDGKVTMDEISGKKLTVAKKADANKDGVITLDEVKAYVSSSVDKKMAKKDLDKDGKLSKEERKRKMPK